MTHFVQGVPNKSDLHWYLETLTMHAPAIPSFKDNHKLHLRTILHWSNAWTAYVLEKNQILYQMEGIEFQAGKNFGHLSP